MLIKVDHCFRSSLMRAVIRKQGFVLLMLIISVAVTAQWSKPPAPVSLAGNRMCLSFSVKTSVIDAARLRFTAARQQQYYVVSLR
jgi:hypothetical protein